MKPVLQALVIADRIYRDAASGKHVIAGTFNRLFFSKTPPMIQSPTEPGKSRMLGGLDAGSPYAYVSLTDVRGTMPLVFRYVDLSDNTTVFQADFEVKANSPLDTVELIMPLPRLPVPHAGVFAFEILCGDEALGAHRIVVEEMKPPPNAPGPIEAGG